MDVTKTTSPRKARKVAQVLSGARRIFLRDGFSGASVDDIAREAGVSKATLYSYFPDKSALFRAVLQEEYRKRAIEDGGALPYDRPPSQVLTLAAGRIIDFVLSDFGLRVFRICASEAERFPGLGEEFYQNGPAKIEHWLTDYLHAAVASGNLVIADVPLAASQFLHLCKAELRDQRLFGLRLQHSPEEILKVATGAVTMFMACYGPHIAPAPQP